MLKNLSDLSFRGAPPFLLADDEESRPDHIGVCRARFLASLGMTVKGSEWQHLQRFFSILLSSWRAHACLNSDFLFDLENAPHCTPALPPPRGLNRFATCPLMGEAPTEFVKMVSTL